MKIKVLVILGLIITVNLYPKTGKPLKAGSSISVWPQDVQKIDRESFFKNCERTFSKKITSGKARETIGKIFDYCEEKGYNDKRWIAYILATAYRESATSMIPLREGKGCITDECSIEKVTTYIDNINKKIILNNQNSAKKKNLKENYALPHANGNSYFGRGLVQITGFDNYQTVGEKIGWGSSLADNPSLALELDKSVIILVEGCVQGLFTGKKLSMYFNEKITDWINARNIVNPKTRYERKKITAAFAENFYSCLK